MRHYRYSSHTFIAKHKMVGLQAGDTLAWLARKEAEEEEKSAGGLPSRQRRRDFQALIGTTEEELLKPRHSYRHFDADILKADFSKNADPSMIWWEWSA